MSLQDGKLMAGIIQQPISNLQKSASFVPMMVQYFFCRSVPVNDSKRSDVHEAQSHNRVNRAGAQQRARLCPDEEIEGTTLRRYHSRERHQSRWDAVSQEDYEYRLACAESRAEYERQRRRDAEEELEAVRETGTSKTVSILSISDHATQADIVKKDNNGIGTVEAWIHQSHDKREPGSILALMNVPGAL